VVAAALVDQARRQLRLVGHDPAGADDVTKIVEDVVAHDR
jgi:hypothetical protein